LIVLQIADSLNTAFIFWRYQLLRYERFHFQYTHLGICASRGDRLKVMPINVIIDAPRSTIEVSQHSIHQHHTITIQLAYHTYM